jgi:hypothetical protein
MKSRRHIARQRRTGRAREKGMAFVLALFTVGTLLVAASTALLVGSADIRATRNYRQAAQAHFVAEAGIAHAMQVINGPGVINFQNDVVNNWGTVFGAGTKTFGPVASYTYNVQAFGSVANPAGAGTLRATSNGPEGVHNVVVASIVRSNIPNTAPGAVYLAQNAQTDATFNGNNFQINGNDRNLDGTPGPNPPVPGLSTRNNGNTQEALQSLSGVQLDNITGLGYIAGPPIVPSVMTSGWAPSVAQLNQICTDLLALPGVVSNGGGNITGNQQFGTESTPVITHFTANTTIKATGNSTGAGIMIVDGDLTLEGSLDFAGLIIVRGQTNVTTVTGNATIYGSIWTNDVHLDVAGSSIVQYSSQGLALANQVSQNTPLPSPIQVVALLDCAALAPGTPPCP